jgi:glycosyltransferase involved in cell wall biosynthesis
MPENGGKTMDISKSDRPHPLVTAGITCYNAETTIERAVRSALSQTWENLEIVVVDDGSTDNSSAILEGIRSENDGISVYRHERNAGYAAALNTIVAKSRGRFIALFDDDDESVSDRIEKQWERLTNYEQKHRTKKVLCYSNRNLVAPDGNFRANGVLAIGRSEPEPRGESVADFLLWHRRDPRYVWGQFGSCTLMSRKETIVGIGGFDERFRRGAEWDLAIRLSLSGGHFISVNEPLITQFITQTTDKAGNVPLNHLVDLRRKHKAHLKSKRLYRASVAMAHARFHYARKQKTKSRFYLALACVCSPFRVLPSELANWRKR